MSLTKRIKVGKKNTIYVPKAIVEATGLEEGEEIMLTVEGERITVEKLQDPLELALSEEEMPIVKPKQIEEISLEKQRERAKGPS